MKSALIIPFLMWLPYSVFYLPGTHGNPDDTPYAGQPDSAYDPAVNPPRVNGVVTYDPMAAMPAAPIGAPIQPGDNGMFPNTNYGTMKPN